MARVRPAPRPGAGVIPEPLRSRLHPLWGDFDAIVAEYGGYLDRADLRVVRMHTRLAYQRVLHRWACENGYESEKYFGVADWHRLRSAGLTHH